MLKAAKTVFKFCQKFIPAPKSIGNTGYGVSSLCPKNGHDSTKITGIPRFTLLMWGPKRKTAKAKTA